VIRFERSFDYELIRSILTHVRIWPFISDDGSPPVEEYKPIEHDAIWYVIVRDVHDEGTDLLGLWMFHPQNAVCWEVHTCLLPAAWGERGQFAASLLPAWIWANTPCRRIVTNVPTTNRLALHFAIKAGMKIYGVNEASFLKRGILMDQVCLGITASAEIPAGEAETIAEVQEV
jgi:RimJ/RimL family protein N-acetyltransferase